MTIRQALFSFRGRMSRSDYWLKGALVLAPFSILTNGLYFGTDSGGAQALAMVLSLFSLWPALALIVKRLHDRDRSGWFAATLLIPFANLVFLFVVMIQVWFMKGTDGPNRFGEDPTDPAAVGEPAAVSPLASVKRWSALFDKEKYGLIWLFVVFYVLAELLVALNYSVLGLLFGLGQGGPPLAYHLIQLVTATVQAAVLLMLFYVVRRDSLLPLVWGATSVLYGIGTRLLAQNLQIENITFSSALAWQPILTSFLYGVLFMGGLVVAVRLGGVTLGSLALGAIVAELLFNEVVIPIAYSHEFWLRFFSYSLVQSVTNGFIYGTLIYAAFHLHFRSRRISPTH